jgi:hypothetical protein
MGRTGQHRAGGTTRPRIVVAIVVTLVLIGLAVRYTLTRTTGGPVASASPAPSRTRSPTPSVSPSPTLAQSPSTTPTASPSPSPTDDPNALPPGRNFVYARRADAAGNTLTVDLAYFYTGQEAADQAKAHGDESPPPNGYYIVNDNPKVRTVPVSPTVVVRYIPPNHCCALKSGTWDAFAAAVDGTQTSGYPTMTYTPWWVTVIDGKIVSIRQQFLP